MGFYSDFMVFCSDLMGFYSDLTGCSWDKWGFTGIFMGYLSSKILIQWGHHERLGIIHEQMEGSWNIHGTIR